ncbi:MFS transporter [Microbacterium thalli]|uniref:MFS transporter n=1 Tax=Microbacterium thalli TaxID=3027921 RepID=A0ABT5SGM4_9MICO|nr:MFS transporter [Microbacterium thalli]MDD7961930.1 MFS transporter [Microbacterium thalli]
MSTPPPSYRAVLRAPGIRPAFLPSIIGRLSLATSGLALVLMLEQATGSFAVAGAITAALGIANVIATPVRARLIDRLGQLAILTALGALHTLSLIAFAVFPAAPLPVLLVLSIVAGVSSPPFGATMRVVWSDALPAGALRTRGFSLDAVAEEVTFAVGPLVAAALVALSGPVAALVLSAGCVAVGTGLFVASGLSRQQRGSHRATADEATSPKALTPLRSRGFVPVVLVMTAPGLILGAVELAAPALAVEAGASFLAGILLALFASASAVGGLVFGRLRLAGSHAAQLLALLGVLVVCVGVAGAVGGPIAGAVGLLIGGLCLAPLLIVGYLSADELTDPRVRTEASSWINTAVNLGAAVGALVFGVITDAAGPGWALGATALTAAVVGLAVAPLLVRRNDATGRRRG